MQKQTEVKMESFILAAGLGTRLRPLTDHCPKALVKVGDRTLLEIAIQRMIRLGVSRIVINIHHHGEQIIEYVEHRQWGCEIVISDEREALMDTGGGLSKAANLFKGDGPIIVHNVDILSRIDLPEMVRHHNRSGSLATLAVSERETSRYLLWSQEGRLIGWHNRSSNEQLWVDAPETDYKHLAFSGITIIEPQLLRLLPQDGHPYPIIPEYLKIARDKLIDNYIHDATDWIDVGKPETLSRAAYMARETELD